MLPRFFPLFAPRVCVKGSLPPTIARFHKRGMQRYLIIDFETNGRPHDKVLPCAAYPTQVSVDAYYPETQAIDHLYDSFIRGAGSLTQWVLENTPVTLDLLEQAPTADVVSADLANLYREGDVMVAHQAQFDLGTVLPKIADMGHPFLNAPVICTVRPPWACAALGKSSVSLQDLCRFLGVEFDDDKAHDATYDTRALALCMKSAQNGLPRTRNILGFLGMPSYNRAEWSVMSPCADRQTLKFGKHKGSTFTEVLERHPTYCEWLLENAADTTFGPCAKFVDWLRHSWTAQRMADFSAQ